MNKKTLCLLSGAFLVGSVSVVNAEEAMTLSVDQMDKVTAGVGFTSITSIQKLVDIQELIQEQKLALFQVASFVTGFSAVAEAEADAEGPNADAQTFTFAEIEPLQENGFAKANSLAKSIALMSPTANGPTVPAPAPTVP